MPDLESPSLPPPVSLFEAAFDATAAARAALSPAALLSVNLDAQTVATTALRASPALAALREAVVRELPTCSVEPLDRLEAYAHALLHAQTALLAASAPADELSALAARAITIRAQLRSDAAALAKRHLLDARRLADLTRETGYLNIASDLGVLVRLFRDRWSEIATKSAVSLDELADAEQMFERLTLAYAARGRRPAAVMAATDARQRAYTLVVNAYAEARRFAAFLRWEPHVLDTKLPSLWAGRAPRRKRHAPVSAGSPAPVPAVAAASLPMPELPQALPSSGADVDGSDAASPAKRVRIGLAAARPFSDGG